jgi:hypothetical protein
MKVVNTVSFSLAQALHKAGYTQPAQVYYNIYNKFLFMCQAELHSEAVWAPTYQEVADWLKRVHNLQIEPNEPSIYIALNYLGFYEK